jgi:tetratricopeptide (TPR) repeat protein
MKLALAAACLAIPTTTAAQPAPKPAAAEVDDHDKEIAKAFANKGRALLEAGEYAKAIEAFREAEKLVSATTIVYFRGTAHEKLGQLRDARDAYKKAAEAELPAGASAALVNAQKEAKAALAAIEPRIPTIEIAPDASAPKGEVKLDGAVVSAADLGQPIAVDPGKHVVSAEAPGRKPFSRELVVAEKARERVAIELPAPARSGKGDGLPPVKDQGGQRSWVLPGVALGVGAAGLIAGAVTGGLALAKMGDIRKACGPSLACPDSERGDVDSARAMGTVSTVGFVVAGVGAAAGVGLVIWQRRDKPATTAVVAGPGTIGVKGAW